MCSDAFDFTSSVDGYGLSLELVASHESGELEGMRTYRIYLDVANSDDQVTSFTGSVMSLVIFEHHPQAFTKTHLVGPRPTTSRQEPWPWFLNWPTTAMSRWA